MKLRSECSYHIANRILRVIVDPKPHTLLPDFIADVDCSAFRTNLFPLLQHKYGRHQKKRRELIRLPFMRFDAEVSADHRRRNITEQIRNVGDRYDIMSMQRPMPNLMR